MSDAEPPRPPASEGEFPTAEVQPAGFSFRSWLFRTWPIWTVAILCLGITAGLVAISLGTSGPRITVTFPEGYGIKPGDRLRHRGIDVGEVTTVKLNPELDGVRVTMTLMPAAKDIARKGSRFWIERPRISLTQISGLETVVGAKYVGVLPGPADAEEAFEFDGMESPPLFHDADSVEVAVHFRDGYGLTAGDAVKHRGILIGEVTSVELDPKFDGVEVRVRLVGRATGLARAGSQFWIERPRVSVAEIRGLDTLVQGRYLAVAPGHSDAEPRRSFVGLESAPAGELPVGGLEILLQGTVKHGLAPGTPVMYRGHQVGQIMSVGLAHDAATVDARALIQPEYRSLVRDNSKFWNNSGLHLRFGFTGLELGTETLSNLAQGGVSFATPTEPGTPVATGQRFEVADQPESAWQAWTPRIPVGTGLLREGLTYPSPERATLRWKDSFIGISRSKQRQGWVLPIEGGRYLLGPKELLTPVEGAKDETVLEVSGREIAILDENVNVAGELALLRLDGEPISPERSWSRSRLRSPAKLESTMLVADPQIAKLPLPEERLSVDEETGHWRVDASVPMDADWHGGCLVSLVDGHLIGIALISDQPAKIALIPENLEFPDPDS